MAWSGKRILIGCGIGCATLILLVVVLGIGFTAWLNRPGELLEPERLLGSDTTGYLEWRLSLDDPGTEGFVSALIQKAREMPPEMESALPPWFGSWLSERQGRKAERDIHAMLPLVAAWTLRPGATSDDDLQLFSVSLARIGNRLVIGDWILGLALRKAEEASIDNYRKEKIYGVPLGNGRSLTFFIRGNDFFLTSDVETARLAVDRLLEAERESRETTDLDRLFATHADARPLRGALTNERGEIVRIWRELIGQNDDLDRLRAVRGATLSGGFGADGSFAGTLELIGPDARWAEATAGGLTRDMRDGLAHLDLELEIDGAAVDDRVRVELRAPDLVGFIHRLDDRGNRGGVRVDF